MVVTPQETILPLSALNVGQSDGRRSLTTRLSTRLSKECVSQSLMRAFQMIVLAELRAQKAHVFLTEDDEVIKAPSCTGGDHDHVEIH